MALKGSYLCIPKQGRFYETITNKFGFRKLGISYITPANFMLMA